MIRSAIRPAGLFLVVLTTLSTGVAVYRGSYGLGAFVLYLASVLGVVLLVLGGLPRPRAFQPSSLLWRSVLPVLALVVLQLALARYFASFPLHFHHDEFETAYASWSLPDFTTIQWFVGYPEPGVWVASFPSVFFVLQKPMLTLLGPTVDAVRISVWPYLALTVVYLYLIARELSRRPAFAFGAGLCAIVFAPSLYITSLGVHFHSSTLFLVAASYHLLRLLRTESRTHAVLTGLFCAFAYLTYTASYITLPVLLGYVAFESIARRSTRPFRLFLPALAVFVVVMLPFVVYALTERNYFLERVRQINTLSGTMVTDPALERGRGALAFLQERLAANVRSLVESRIGGADGYTFGRQPLFDQAGIILFALGAVYGLLRLHRGEARAFVLVVGSLLAAFASGLVMTMPSGGFHRVSLVFPFVGLVVALGLLALYEGARLAFRNPAVARPIGSAVVAAALVAYSALNLTRAYEMSVVDQTHDSPRVYSAIVEHVPETEVVGIAFAPNYHLGRELFFRTGGRHFETNWFREILDDPTYRYFVLAYPRADAFEELLARYPSAQVISAVDGVRMQDHYIVITNQEQATTR